jgi:hypothetical protein
MPLKLARLFLMFAVALAVPLQGFASVAAGLCMTMGHHAADHHHDGDEAAEAAGHQHQGGDSSAGGSHCPPCVSCCAAAAIVPAVQLLVSDAAPVAPVAAKQYSVSGTLPETLDRPPLAS